MLNKKLEKALNDHIQAEMASAYLYLSMSSWFKARNLNGFANWMSLQAQEELAHSMKFYDYIHNRGGEVELQELPAPPKSWGSPLAVFEHTCKHEQHVTKRINDLCELADINKDNATRVLLNWFVAEQVEEEATALGVVEQLKMIEGHPGGIYMLDKEMAGRSVSPEVA